MSHNYSTDSAERRYIPFFIAASAIGTTFLIFHFLNKYHIEIPWWASPPVDTMALYGFFYWLFDKYVWKWQPLHKLRITKIPDLSGEWRGKVVPTETNGVSRGLGTPMQITLSIRQTWTRLLINGRTDLSKSYSVSGTFTVSGEPRVSYDYINEPLAIASATMHTHRGTVRLSLDEIEMVLDGEYYSGRDRQNIGTIRVTREVIPHDPDPGLP